MKKYILSLFFFVMLVPMVSIAKDYSDYAEECEPIRKEIQEILLSYDISSDYFFLLVAEAHCKNKTSKSGAVGYWQMMPATARKYGCNDPKDLICETHAAAKYLRRLEEKCGKENVVYCWHDGGSNYLRHGKKPTKAAEGLNWQYNHLRKSFGK